MTTRLGLQEGSTLLKDADTVLAIEGHKAELRKPRPRRGGLGTLNELTATQPGSSSRQRRHSQVRRQMAKN